MNHSLQVIAIDGVRGTGKSRLATGLRTYFGCGVLEIGPLFRFLALVLNRGDASDLKDACELTDHALKTEKLRIRSDVGSNLAASRLEFDGRGIDDELWNTRLDETLRSVADSPYAISFITQLARRFVGSKPTVVIGREVGKEFFPDAALKIILRASDSARKERKLNQLNQSYPRVDRNYSLEQSEPPRRWEYDGGTLTIDTTNLTADEVCELVAEKVVDDLNWTIVTQNEEAPV